MATISITSWKDEVHGFTGWDRHAREETKCRLKSSLNLSPAELREMLRAIRKRQPVTIRGVNKEQVPRLLQILQTAGADVEARPDD